MPNSLSAKGGSTVYLRHFPNNVLFCSGLLRKAAIKRRYSKYYKNTLTHGGLKGWESSSSSIPGMLERRGI